MSGLILGAVVLLIAGYAKLSSMILNRIIAVPLPAAKQKIIEIIQLFSMPAYAVILPSVLYFRHAGFGSLSWETMNNGELNTKTYSLNRLPQAWDGLSIVHFADTHFRGAVTRRYFELVCEQARALEPDLFVFSGDLFDDLELLDWLRPTLGQLKAPLGQYFVLGNHDWFLDANVVRQEYERDGWIDISSRSIELKSGKSGPPIVIAGDETPWMGTHPDLSHVSPETFRILLSHVPDNIYWAQKQKFDLMLAGHTHGGQIRLPVLGPVYAPSLYGCRFASGVFWMDPTLLYVSRGISGREPIRYNCVPELTKLVLRCGNR